MIIGHIGVRKGSKGVPNKNFRPIAGKPLLDWSLDQLKEHTQIDHFVISTDCTEMHAHALNKGSLDIGLRPAHLATDTASKWDVWQHTLSCIEDQYGQIDAFVDLDCTSPLRKQEDIDNAISLFFDKKPDMVMSCCTARKNPYFNLVEPDENGFVHLSKKLDTSIVSRQQAPIVYEHAASTYVLSPSYLKSAKFIYDGNVLPLIMPAERCIDIDDEIDFEFVEFKLEKSQKNDLTKK